MTTGQSTTPLTDDLKRPAMTFEPKDEVVSAKFMAQQEEHARSLELKLQETVLWIEKSNTAQYAQELELKLQETEQKENSCQIALTLAQHRANEAERARDINARLMNEASVLVCQRENELDEVKRQRDEAKQREQRLFDLVRYQRAELHQADLITDDEYTMLCVEGGTGNMAGSVQRLEGYDSMWQERDQLIKVVDEMATAGNGMLEWSANHGKAAMRDAIESYSLLPHVQAKKGNKQ